MVYKKHRAENKEQWAKNAKTARKGERLRAKNFSVTDVVAANFNKIYWVVFNDFENNPVRIAYRERVILFKIPLQSMSLKSFIKDVFLKDSKALSQLLFLFLRKPRQILMPALFEDTVKMNWFRLNTVYPVRNAPFVLLGVNHIEAQG